MEIFLNVSRSSKFLIKKFDHLGFRRGRGGEIFGGKDVDQKRERRVK